MNSLKQKLLLPKGSKGINMKLKERIIELYILAVSQVIVQAIEKVNSVMGITMTIAMIMLITVVAFGNSKKKVEEQ